MSYQNWIKRADGKNECLEAFFWGKAYGPHRHDTYTLALTTHGVQSFNYRGATRYSLPGQVVVLHPDELHDGQAGTDVGFGYKSVCLPPTRIQQILGGQVLPFIKTGVSSSPRLKSIMDIMTSELEHILETEAYEDALFDLVSELSYLSIGLTPSPLPNYKAVALARDYIDANISRGFKLADLETQTDQNRWQLSRDFRSAFGTSPYRYLIMRRLEKARVLISKGSSLAEAALDSYFSDQSHFQRHFNKTFGIPPKAWLDLTQANLS